MTFLYPFKMNFAGEEREVWAVNTDEPLKAHSSVTTAVKCPNCGVIHFYKFVEDAIRTESHEEEGYFLEFYRCKCASCRQPFEAEIDFEY